MCDVKELTELADILRHEKSAYLRSMEQPVRDAAELQAKCERLEREAKRLHRIVTTPPGPSLFDLHKEIEALGNVTPEACRAIDVWNHRKDKQTSIERERELVKERVAAERRAEAAESQLTALKAQLAKEAINPAWGRCGWTMCHICDECGTTWGTDSKHKQGKLPLTPDSDKCPRCSQLAKDAEPLPLPTHECWWWEWDEVDWRMRDIKLDSEGVFYFEREVGHKHIELVPCKPGRWLPVAVPPKPEGGGA